MSIIVPALGSTSLGIVMGWLVRYFIRRFETFTPSVFGSVISIVVGGAVVKFLGPDQNVIWFYPIGLLIGFVAYQAIAMSLLKEPREIVSKETGAGWLNSRRSHPPYSPPTDTANGGGRVPSVFKDNKGEPRFDNKKFEN